MAEKSKQFTEILEQKTPVPLPTRRGSGAERKRQHETVSFCDASGGMHRLWGSVYSTVSWWRKEGLGQNDQRAT